MAAHVRQQFGRHGGHLFIFIDGNDILDEPDRVRQVAGERRPGETAFVLAQRGDGDYAYLGVGLWLDDDARWAIPEADYTTWRNWGAGRETSRRLPEGALSRAQLVTDALLAMPEERRWIEQPDGRRARVLGMAQRGGIRVDGVDGGFKERLGRANLRITDVLVESRDTAALDRDQRRVELADRPYPLEIDDAEAIRKAMSSAQARVGRQPEARGSGNRTRRLRILVEGTAKLGADALGRGSEARRTCPASAPKRPLRPASRTHGLVRSRSLAADGRG